MAPNTGAASKLAASSATPSCRANCESISKISQSVCRITAAVFSASSTVKVKQVCPTGRVYEKKALSAQAGTAISQFSAGRQEQLQIAAPFAVAQLQPVRQARHG